MSSLISSVKCPTCGATEEHPTDDCAIQIRVNKVHDEGNWWSQCLVCSGGYDKPGGAFDELKHDADKGWFVI